MLVLTRKSGESIVIDGEITVTLISVQGGKARLGISAPSHVRVMRSELLPRQVSSELPANRALLAGTTLEGFAGNGQDTVQEAASSAAFFISPTSSFEGSAEDTVQESAFDPHVVDTDQWPVVNRGHPESDGHREEPPPEKNSPDSPELGPALAALLAAALEQGGDPTPAATDALERLIDHLPDEPLSAEQIARITRAVRDRCGPVFRPKLPIAGKSDPDTRRDGVCTA